MPMWFLPIPPPTSQRVFHQVYPWSPCSTTSKDQRPIPLPSLSSVFYINGYYLSPQTFFLWFPLYHTFPFPSYLAGQSLLVSFPGFASFLHFICYIISNCCNSTCHCTYPTHMILTSAKALILSSKHQVHNNTGVWESMVAQGAWKGKGHLFEFLVPRKETTEMFEQQGPDVGQMGSRRQRRSW